jgi:predicted nuclease of predicted toxin-antitoxin system
MLRFHLDEHVPHAIAAGLRAKGVDVTTTTDAGLIGEPDEDHIAFARRESRVVFTNDDDFLVHAARNKDHAGIAFCAQQKHGDAYIGRVIHYLYLMHEVLEAEEIQNTVEYL